MDPLFSASTLSSLACTVCPSASGAGSSGLAGAAAASVQRSNSRRRSKRLRRYTPKNRNLKPLLEELSSITDSGGYDYPNQEAASVEKLPSAAAAAVTVTTVETAELLGKPQQVDEQEDSNSTLPSWKKNFWAACLARVRLRMAAFIHPNETKMSLKLFGSKKAVQKERARCSKTHWVIHPFSTFRFSWDFVMLMLLITNLVVLPVGIAFFDDNLSDAWLAFNCVNDAIFVLDIFLNLRTGIAHQQMAVQVILEPQQIRKTYLKSWFWVDFISSIPLDYLCSVFTDESTGGPQLLGASRTLKMLRMTKLLSLMRLLRISRLMRYASQWEEVFNLASAAFKILNLIFMMVLISHWNGCLMFLIPRLYEYPKDCWVYVDGLIDKPWTEQYSWALFRAMSHMLCIGYGQEPPRSLLDLWFVIISMLSGATCYALFIGHATNMIQQFDSSHRIFTEKMKQIEEYMAHRKLNPELQIRVHEYYEYKYKGKMFDEELILEELNECIREEILNYNCRDLVRVVPFFTEADPQFVSAIVARLRFEVYQPGDCIIQEGTIGCKMFFILQGSVDVLTSHSDTPIAQLSDGAYFGEICLLARVKRTATIRADTYCDLYSLGSDDFLEVLTEFPHMRVRMEGVARERLAQLGRKTSVIHNRSRTSHKADEYHEVSDDSESNLPSPQRVNRKLRRKSLDPAENSFHSFPKISGFPGFPTCRFTKVSEARDAPAAAGKPRSRSLSQLFTDPSF